MHAEEVLKADNSARLTGSLPDGLPRSFDVAVSLILLVLSAPLLLLSAVAVMLTSPGGFLFPQKRVGRHGNTFVLYKLRTMRASSTGPQVTSGDDARITQVGKFLRKTKLDELPTLWNVLRGDMSLVGPRPEVPRYFDRTNPRWQVIMEVRPGVTDPVTLQLRDEEALLAEVGGNIEHFYVETLQPMKLDGYVHYLQQRSWKSDLHVFWKTAIEIIRLPLSPKLRTASLDQAVTWRPADREPYRTQVGSVSEHRLRVIVGMPPKAAIIYLMLFVVAAGFYTILWKNAPLMSGDSSDYMEAAQDLSDGSIDYLNNRSPGFPLFLILTGATKQPTHTFWFVSLLLHFCTVWLLARALHMMRLSESSIILFGVILLLPPYVEGAGYLMSENLTQFCIIVAITSLIWWFGNRRTIWLIISALAIAYSGLVRPTYQVFALIIAGWILLLPLLYQRVNLQWAQAVKASVILVLVSILILGGYSFLNYRKFGYFGITPLLGFNLCTKTVPFVERLPDQYADVREMLINARDQQLTKRGSSHTGVQYIWSIRPRGIQEKTGLTKAEASKFMLRLNLLLIRKAPLEYLNEVAESATRYWFPANRGLSNMGSRFLQTIWTTTHFLILGFFALQLVVLVGASIFQASRKLMARNIKSIIGIGASYRLPILAYVLSGITLFYTMIITCMVDVGDPRQRSGDALLIFMLFVGFHIWCCSIRESKPEKMATLL